MHFCHCQYSKPHTCTIGACALLALPRHNYPAHAPRRMWVIGQYPTAMYNRLPEPKWSSHHNHTWNLHICAIGASVLMPFCHCQYSTTYISEDGECALISLTWHTCSAHAPLAHVSDCTLFHYHQCKNTRTQFLRRCIVCPCVHQMSVLAEAHVRLSDFHCITSSLQ